MDTITDIELEKQPIEKKETKTPDLPIYLEQVKLSDDDKKRIIDEIIDELDEIREERNDEKIDENFDALDNQYEGKVTEDERRMFNLSRQVTRVKVNKVVNLIMQAFLKGDPKYSVSPRPEFQRQGGQEICDKQSDFLDYKLDNLPFRDPEGQVVHNSVLKGIGLLKIRHLIKREKRKREETYKGENKVEGVDPRTGQPIIKNDGLEEFLRNWPDAPKEYPQFVKQLAEGKEIRFVAQFTDTTYNDPYFTSVNPKNFFARLCCDGYEGLKTTKLTVEKMEYTYWDLKREEKRGYFYDVDDITYDSKAEGKRTTKFKNKMYTILECVYYAKLKEGDDEEVKCVFWISEDKRKMIGSILYPYYGIDCYYVPHYISRKKRGLYGEGLGKVLTDSHAAENAILNAVLESAWMTNLITPIIERQGGAYTQMMSKSWTHGVPLTINKGETIDFLQKYMRPVDTGGMLTLLQFLLQGDDDATGVSSLMSGRESPLDPTAPASKTMALLQQSGVSVEDYILTMSPSFNTVGEILLQMYYQMAQDGVDYQVKPDRVTGVNPFSKMTRADMIAKTNIQVQASSFNFDRLEENKKDLALYNLMRQDPILARNPEAIYTLAKNLIKGWSPKWSNLIDQLMPSPEQFSKQQMMVAANAVGMYVQNAVKTAQTTGQAPEIDPRQLVQVVAQLQQEAVTPPPPEVQKARQEGA